MVVSPVVQHPNQSKIYKTTINLVFILIIDIQVVVNFTSKIILSFAAITPLKLLSLLRSSVVVVMVEIVDFEIAVSLDVVLSDSSLTLLGTISFFFKWLLVVAESSFLTLLPPLLPPIAGSEFVEVLLAAFKDEADDDEVVFADVAGAFASFSASHFLMIWSKL